MIGKGFESIRGISGSTCIKKERLILSISEVESTRGEERSAQTKKVREVISVDESSSQPEDISSQLEFEKVTFNGSFSKVFKRSKMPEEV